MKLKSLLFMVFVSLFAVTAASAQTKRVWISSKVAVNLTLANSLSGQTITFNLQDGSGKSLGQATVPADQALGSSLASFFQSVSDAIRELVGGGDQGGYLTITVTPEGTTVANLGGNVSITDASGNTTKVDIGSGAVLNSDGTHSEKTLAQIVAAEQAAGTASNENSVTASLGATLKDLADKTSKNEAGTNSLQQMAALVKVVSEANPSAAADYVKTAVAALTASGSGIKDPANAIAAIVEAASKNLSGDALLAVKNAATEAATQNGVTDAAAAASLGAERGTSTTPVQSTIIVPASPS